MPETIDWPPARQSRARWVLLFIFLALVVLIFIGGRAAISYWVDLLWFGSLGFADVFWKIVEPGVGNVRGLCRAHVSSILFGAFLALRHSHGGDLPETHTIFFAGRPVSLPVGKGSAHRRRDCCAAHLHHHGLRHGVAVAHAGALLVRAAHRQRVAGDPIFGRSLGFYLFTLPAWQLIAGWLLALAVLICDSCSAVSHRRRRRPRAGRAIRRRRVPALARRFHRRRVPAVTLAIREYIGRFELLFEHHTIFDGVTYTDAHVTLIGMSVYQRGARRSAR